MLEMERESSHQIAKQDLARPHPTTPDMATIRTQQRVCRTTRNINKAQGSNQDLVLWRLVLCMGHGAQAREGKELEDANSEDQKRTGNKKTGNTKICIKRKGAGHTDGWQLQQHPASPTPTTPFNIQTDVAGRCC